MNFIEFFSLVIQFKHLKSKLDNLKRDIFTIIDIIKKTNRIKGKRKSNNLNYMFNMEKLCMFPKVEKLMCVPKQNNNHYIRLLSLTGLKGFIII